jgi:hypothetical protein
VHHVEARLRPGHRPVADPEPNRVQILGLNAARLFNIDAKATRHAIRADRLTKLREEYQRDPHPSNRQFGWVWVEDGTEPTVPVGQVG